MLGDTEADALRQRVAELEEELARYRTWRPPGDFYSPIPDLTEVQARAESIFCEELRDLPGIESRVPEQVALAQVFLPFYADQPWSAEGSPDRRYRFENDQFSYADALFLHFMMRHVLPRRIVEVGSGHSSAAMLDTSELFLDGAVDFTFIDPYPQRLHSILRPDDHDHVRILSQPVQDVPLETFDQLQANDILFIDSTHVSKTGSDVHRLYFDVLPRLAKGVYIHVHDIHFPFEYPREWVMEGRAWNEAYLLRAFLQFNSDFEIVVMNTALERFRLAWFQEHMPLCLKNSGGSIWLRRIA